MLVMAITKETEMVSAEMVGIDRWRLTAVLLANGLLRVANAAGGALVGFYLAYLVTQGRAFDAALVGGLGLVANLMELVGAIPFGSLADRYPPRSLLVVGALIGAISTQLFGITGLVAIFYLSRGLEGVAAAATGPALLAYLTDLTQGNEAVRGRIMSFFELSLLTGLAMGTLVGGLTWERMQTTSFSLMAAIYLVVAVLFYWGAEVTRPNASRYEHPLAGLRRAWSDVHLRRLAPAWLAANGVAGLWLTHIVFQLSGPTVAGQFLVGRFTAREIGYLALVYALVFGAGVVVWGYLLARVSHVWVMRVSVWGMFGVSVCFYLLNISAEWSMVARGGVVLVYSIMIMVQSGFTPAALTYLVDVAGRGEGRGATMGVYTLLLGLGTAVGAVVGGIFARDLYINGLLIGTVLLGLVGLVALRYLPDLASNR